MQFTRFIARSTETKISFVIFFAFSIWITSLLYGTIQENFAEEVVGIHTLNLFENDDN